MPEAHGVWRVGKAAALSARRGGFQELPTSDIFVNLWTSNVDLVTNPFACLGEFCRPVEQRACLVVSSFVVGKLGLTGRTDMPRNWPLANNRPDLKDAYACCDA